MVLRDLDASAAPDGARHGDVSIIIGTYRAQNRIRAALRDVVAQCRPGIELIVVDDASGDGTAEVVREELAHRDVDSTLISLTRNLGVAQARNLALRHACGAYVLFIDDDDEIAPGAVDALLSAARRHDADLVMGQARRRILSTGETLPLEVVPGETVMNQAEAVAQLARWRIQGHLWNKLFRRSVLGEAPFPPLRSKSDFVGVVRALQRSERVVSIPDLVYTYLWRDGTISTDGGASPLDLFRGFEEATALMVAAPSALAPGDSALFRLEVVRAVRTELWRFGPTSAEAEIAEAYCRGLLGTRAVVDILRSGERGSAVLAAGMAYAPGLVGIAYRRRRGGRLTDV